MILTAKRLKKLGACRRHVAKFRQAFPRGVKMPSTRDGRNKLATRLATFDLDVVWYVERFRMTINFTDRKGTQRWYHRGRLHREGYPAVIHTSSCCEFWLNGNRRTLVSAHTYSTDTGLVLAARV